MHTHTATADIKISLLRLEYKISNLSRLSLKFSECVNQFFSLCTATSLSFIHLLMPDFTLKTFLSKMLVETEGAKNAQIIFQMLSLQFLYYKGPILLFFTKLFTGKLLLFLSSSFRIWDRCRGKPGFAAFTRRNAAKTCILKTQITKQCRSNPARLHATNPIEV